MSVAKTFIECPLAGGFMLCAIFYSLCTQIPLKLIKKVQKCKQGLKHITPRMLVQFKIISSFIHISIRHLLEQNTHSSLQSSIELTLTNQNELILTQSIIFLHMAILCCIQCDHWVNIAKFTICCLVDHFHISQVQKFRTQCL